MAETVWPDTRTAPIGTKAPAIGGGWWFKTARGWKWNGPNGSGGTFPSPGGDWDWTLVLPDGKVRKPERK